MQLMYALKLCNLILNQQRVLYQMNELAGFFIQEVAM